MVYTPTAPPNDRTGVAFGTQGGVLVLVIGLGLLIGGTGEDPR